MRSEPITFPGRDEVSPRAGRDAAAELYREAGITNPRKDIDVAEVYVPFSWYEPMWMENLGFAPKNEGWKMTAEGATAFDGDMPINPSGGVLSSNPIGASGMIRFAEAAMQVRGQAGEHQVDGAKVAHGPCLRRRLAVLRDVARRKRAELMEFNLADLFEGVADAVPDREALVCGDRRLTYQRAG